MATVYLERRNKLIMVEGAEKTPHISLIATMIRNIESLGFKFSSDVIDVLKTLPEDTLESTYHALVSILRNQTGANKIYRPMYPNFPKQVMEASAAELYINAIIHYMTLGDVIPLYVKEERPDLDAWLELKTIGLGTREDFLSIFDNLMQAKSSISESDKEDLEWFAQYYPSNFAIAVYQNEIPLKENVAFIGNLLLTYVPDNDDALFQHVKTATDVLRLAVAMSDGDVSLAESTKFRSFKRKERRLLLALLENAGNIEEDMKRYTEEWKRLGERLHPSEFKNKYLKSQEAFNKLRKGIKIDTFGGRLAEAFVTQDHGMVIDLLKDRPGEFARRLDHIVRTLPKAAPFIVKEFAKVAHKVSVPVLLQVYKHFEQRSTHKAIRSFFPKGNTAKVFSIENTLPDIEDSVLKNIVSVCEDTLVKIFAEKPSLGKVYIDDSLSNYLVPFSQRSASKALKTITRGSKLDLPEGMENIRAFIYWKQGKQSRVDLDLSVVILGDDWQYLDSVYYGTYGLRSHEHGIYHSGDITSAPEGASEFIDINLAKFRESGARYAVISVNNYTNQTFVDLPECFGGWMARKDGTSGEIFEPKTLAHKFDLTIDTQIAIPMIFDLWENKMLWLDLGLNSNPSYVNNVLGNSNSLTAIAQAMSSLAKPSLHELFYLHATARGEIVHSKEEADTVFSLEEGITPFDTDVILAQYL